MLGRVRRLTSALMLAVGLVPAVFAQHTSTTFTQTVNKATPGNGNTPAVTINSSAAPSQYGQSVTLASTVPSAATGSITFMDGGSTIGTATITGGTASLATSALSVGTHSLTASYSGDSNFNAATSSAFSEEIDKANAAASLASSNLTATFGNAITLTATVTPSSATGTVQFMSGATPLGSGTLSGGTAALVLNSLPAGAYSITAVYSGDGNYNGVTSTAISQTVAQVSSTVALASSLNPSDFGGSVTFTATVPASATGSITFKDGSTTLGTGTIASGVATYATSDLTAGTHSITAVYAGDGNFTGATSSVVTQTVNAAGTVSEISMSPTTGINVGTNLTFTALVDTAGTPGTGTVTFKDGTTVLGSGSVSDVSTTNLLPYSLAFGNWTVEQNGVAAPTVTANAAAGPDGTANSATQISYPDTSATGNHGANYAGVSYVVATGNFASTSGTFSVWVKGAQAGTVTLYLADGTKTVFQATDCNISTAWTRCVASYSFPANAAAGATVSVRSWGAVAQVVNIANAQLEQAATAGPYVYTAGASATGKGEVATFSTSALTEGTHSITASYSGDSNFNGSASNALSVSIAKGSASVAIASSQPSSNYGSSVTFTATVTGPETPATGTVTFMDGSTTLGTGTLNGSGVATFTTAALVAGSHSITAVYSGDTQLDGATSSAVTQTVSQVPATIDVTSSANPSTFGDAVTFTITVTGAGATPTGTLTITNGGTTIGTVTLNGSGVATFTTSALNAGSNTLTITYSGNGDYL